MSDIVARLRDWRNVHLARLHLLMEEAADEVARLRSDNSRRANLETGLRDGVVRLSANGDCPGRVNASNEDNLLAEVRRLRAAITALADQAATLSVCNGNVTVTMDATLTDEEREAVDRARIAFRDMDHNAMTMQQIEDYESLCGLLLRLASFFCNGT